MIGLNKRSGSAGIQKRFFRTQLILILTLATFLGASGTIISIHFDTQRRDENLQNIASAVARSPLLTDANTGSSDGLRQYLDTMCASLDKIDVISVISTEGIRLYHSNPDLIGTKYDGTVPDFSGGRDYYAANDEGPSGIQRRAYAGIYSEDGKYSGFVMAIMLMKNVREEIFHVLFVYSIITFAAIMLELLISSRLSRDIKKTLQGYEPDVFSSMYRIRDNILESLDEGIVATDEKGNIQFINKAASRLLPSMPNDLALLSSDLQRDDLLVDSIPILENGKPVGTVSILHDRAEYTRLMEDLAGTRYLVDSMRAGNHDFTNKLHVILGLIQMEMYEEAECYIQNITLIQRETISSIMNAVDDPAVAALLIGKTSRASELNIKFALREDSHYSRTDIALPSEVLITIIGNLIDNGFDAMNNGAYNAPGELLFGIFSRPGALLITTDDTGCGIRSEDQERIFQKGYSTKGADRGTGLWQVRELVHRFHGSIVVESQLGIGTSFAVSFTEKGANN